MVSTRMLGAQPVGAYPERHPSRQIEALGVRQVILRVEVGGLRQLLEYVPDASLTEARARGCDRIVPAIHVIRDVIRDVRDLLSAICGNPRQSAAIRGNPRQSVAISGNPRQSVAS